MIQGTVKNSGVHIISIKGFCLPERHADARRVAPRGEEVDEARPRVFGSSGGLGQPPARARSQRLGGNCARGAGSRYEARSFPKGGTPLRKRSKTKHKQDKQTHTHTHETITLPKRKNATLNTPKNLKIRATQLAHRRAPTTPGARKRWAAPGATKSCAWPEAEIARFAAGQLDIWTETQMQWKGLNY